MNADIQKNRESASADHTDSRHRLFGMSSALVSVVLLAAGLIFTILHGYLLQSKALQEHGIAATLLGHLATALLIAGIWHAVDTYLSRKEFVDLLAAISRRATGQTGSAIRKLEGKIHDLSDQVHASRHERTLGFVRSYVESHPELYEEVLTRSQSLIIVLNNGYVWLHTHREALKERLLDPAKSTTVVLLRVGSAASRLMEQKEIMALGSYDAKLQEALSLLRTIVRSDSQLEIYGVAFPLGQAIFLSETQLLVVPRFVLEPSVPPVFVFDRNNNRKSYYRRVSEDVETLLRHPETVRIELWPQAPVNEPDAA